MKIIDKYGTLWLDYWFSNGEEHQYRFYRCEGCGRLVTWKVIRRGGCDCMRGRNLRPARLSFWDKFRALFLPWTI